MLTEHTAKRLVQQVRCRMIAANIVATRLIHVGTKRKIESNSPLIDNAAVKPLARSVFAGVGHAEADTWGTQHAGVTYLTAGFCVERSAV